MYVCATTKCNMACLHCCHFCRPGCGRHMDMKIFRKIVSFSKRRGLETMLGGGEPTLNPNLLTMLDLLEGNKTIFMTMNGTCSTELWKKLLEIPALVLQVSNSIFHNRAIQNPYVMRSAAQRGMLTQYGDDIQVELVGRALKHPKEIAALAKRRRKRLYFDSACDRSVCVLPDGQLWVWKDGRRHCFGPLSARNYDRACAVGWGF